MIDLMQPFILQMFFNTSSVLIPLISAADGFTEIAGVPLTCIRIISIFTVSSVQPLYFKLNRILIQKNLENKKKGKTTSCFCPDFNKRPGARLP